MRNLLALLVSLALAFSAGLIGSYFTGTAIDTWYATLAKPLLSPPNWIFAPVWTALYICMAVAAWRVYVRRNTPKARTGLVLYGIHLTVNALWSFVFFGLQNPLLAFVVIFILLALILRVAALFYRVDAIAGALFFPYIVWVSFATYLNLMIILLN
jgi:translocator protein